MNRLLFLSALGLTAAGAAAQQTERPNVIFLVADDLGYGDLSCYGAQRVQTPAVDSVAQAGIRFTDAHAVASTSTPSRYSLLTGEYSFRRPDTGVAAGNAALIIRPDQYTLADAFRAQGYATAALGKWHLGLGAQTGKQDWNGEIAPGPADLGFDYSYIMAATADRVPCVYIENGRVANLDPAAPIEVSYRQNFPGEPTGRENPELLTKLRPSHGHDQSIVNGISRIGYMKGGGRALWQDESIADSIVSHAVAFMEREAGKRPFFMYLCTNDVHVPRYPADRFRGKSPMGLRGDAILQFDWTVGRITEALRRLGIAENTLLVITSDNGPVLDDGYADRAEELAGGHKPGGPFRGGKYSAFEAGTTVPFIVSWPGRIEGGRTDSALVSHVDVLASMASLVGTQLPQGAGPDSRDCLDTWLGRRAGGQRDYVVTTGNNRNLEVRTEEWKYIEPRQGGPMVNWGPKIETGNSREPQLYRRTGGNDERRNVAAEHPDLVRQFQEVAARVKAGAAQ